MPAYDNINGVLRKVSKIYDNVGGTLREVKTAYDNVGGVMRKYHSRSGAMYINANHSGYGSSTSYNDPYVSLYAGEGDGDWASITLSGVSTGAEIVVSGSMLVYEYGGTFKVNKQTVFTLPYSFVLANDSNVYFELIQHDGGVYHSPSISFKTTVNGVDVPTP